MAASNLEQRLYRLEEESKRLARSLDTLQGRVNALAQQQHADIPGFGPGGGGGAGYFGATLTAVLTHGAPGPALNGQTVWKLDGGVRSVVNSNATLYNDTPNDIPALKQVILAANPDGTWTAIGVPC